MQIIDVHTHCFPDFLAEKAMQKLTENSKVKAFHDGTLKGLSASMDEAGITKSAIQSIATRPEQTENILEWSIRIRNERFEPFISIHPEYRDYTKILKRAKDHGIKGIKVHPHYQSFFLDDEKLFPMYEAFCEYGFAVLFHAGDDIAFQGYDNASVPRLKKVIDEFPEMKIILAHYGAYRNWQEVYDRIAGTDVFLETSFVLEEAGEEMFLKILNKHSKEKILFGTDSPWTDQKNAVRLVSRSGIDDEAKEAIFYKNYVSLFG
ncbi:MAG: amidohydrolase family protein [Spirochaetes bacterium]|nr:amidohydrolase family protein [Spirochaetota bacterium]